MTIAGRKIRGWTLVGLIAISVFALALLFLLQYEQKEPEAAGIDDVQHVDGSASTGVKSAVFNITQVETSKTFMTLGIDSQDPDYPGAALTLEFSSPTQAIASRLMLIFMLLSY